MSEVQFGFAVQIYRNIGCNKISMFGQGVFVKSNEF